MNEIKLSEKQKHFKELLNQYPRLCKYWDFDKYECCLPEIEAALPQLSTDDKVMLKFLLAVWLGRDRMDVDVLEFAKLNTTDRLVITNWLNTPWHP